MHRAAIALDGKARIVAGSFSRTQEKNRQVAEDLGISSDRCYVTYREMAEKEAERADGIDFVIIVTPNSSQTGNDNICTGCGIKQTGQKPKPFVYGNLHLHGKCDSKIRQRAGSSGSNR